MSVIRNSVLVGLRRHRFYWITCPNRITWHDLEHHGLPTGTTAVVNVAGQNVLDPTKRWTTGFKQNVWNSRVRTTAALSKAIVDATDKPKSFVAISGVGIYEPGTSKEYVEDDVTSEFDYFSKLGIEWEKAAKLPEYITLCRQITIRSGVVLGQDGGMIKQLYLPFYLGLGGPVGSGSQYLPWIHVEDLARLIVFAIEKDGVSGILNGVAPQVITNKEFTNVYAKALWRPALFPLPVSILNAIFSKERAKLITEGQKVLPRRTQAVGFNYLYPDIKSACEELVA
ncbi:epimerase family protein SDR39U1 isoform X3 [Photinus pyralis]|uniref:epimerase family protein SDR39U1 isoform X3 n=1 Tax=Photinus pyralis TaxID=7054 RepID=UPI0012670397|nr:epimerase family protein SDR39U1 isoform X3 [Photinus pyralis]